VRRATWLAWSLCLLFLVLLALDLLLRTRTMPEHLLGFAINALLALPFPILGALVASRRPGNPIGWLMCVSAVVLGLSEDGELYGVDALLIEPGRLPGGAEAAWFGHWVDDVGLGLHPFLLLLFPDGRLPSARWRPVAWLGVASMVLWSVMTALTPGQLEGPDSAMPPLAANPFGLQSAAELVRALGAAGAALVFGVGLAGVASIVVRFRTATGDERQQLKWVAYAGALMLVLIGVNTLLGTNSAVRLHQPDPSLVLLGFVLWGLTAAALPVSIGVAILKYRLYAIDRLISRTVTYGVLWLTIALAYVGLAVGLGLAASERLPLALAIVCTIIATVLFQPARRRLEQLADRWVFGERLGGYQLVARLGTTLEHALGSHEVAPRVAATVRLGLRTRWVRVCVERRTSEGTSLEPIGADGIGLHEPASPALSVPLTHADKQIGIIECGPKEEGAFQARDRELLATLGRQAALAIRNAGLAAELAERLAEIERQAHELAASRTRIVQAEEAGRRRIERDIHDGVQQELVALLAKARLARNQLARDPNLAAATLAELQGDVRQALADLRELAHGIHPPVLSDRGLLEAIEAQTARLPVPVRIDADGLGRGTRYPAEIEGAAYFLICEGLANALKHAAATRLEVRLAALPTGLRLEVADDGRGFEPARVAGSRLRGLADRVEALGGQLEIVSRPAGGTRLIALLPARELVHA
jgi:signal transduction histidine kinase